MNPLRAFFLDRKNLVCLYTLVLLYPLLLLRFFGYHQYPAFGGVLFTNQFATSGCRKETVR